MIALLLFFSLVGCKGSTKEELYAQGMDELKKANPHGAMVCVKNALEKYPHGTPFTKESLLYRDIFEKHFKGHGHLIKDFWMPNQTWDNCKVTDPSARVLPNYGASGK